MELLQGGYDVAQALAGDVAVALIEERVDRPARLVGLAGEILVFNRHRDALVNPVLSERGHERFEVFPEAGDMAAGPEEVAEGACGVKFVLNLC